MQWDLFCRVVDNFGDIGVSWRLAADLASRGETVRLWVDDASALAWMAPGGAEGVTVLPWPGSTFDARLADVVVAAFGCALPPAVLGAMAAAPRAPVWINLEYLGAEPYVERCHGLPSPQAAGPGAGLTQWFFYPGYGGSTGGLIHESDLAARQQAFEPDRWLAAAGVQARTGERIVSLFCYDAQPALAALLDTLASQPTLLLATVGAAQRQLQQLLGAGLARGPLRALALPALSQADYDHLLWASDLNFVRGEDSWVRAQWAGRPFVWQPYPQHDRAHAAKLDAFMDRFVAGAAPPLAAALRRLARRWNGLDNAPLKLPDARAWESHCRAWRNRLREGPDLVSALLGFVAARR